MKTKTKPLRAYQKEYKKWVIGCPNCPSFYKSTKCLYRFIKCNNCGYEAKDKAVK